MKELFGGLFAALLSVSSMAWADDARAPYDYVKKVPGGQYVFVMLATRGNREFDPGAPDDVGVTERDSEIRKRYPQSGLYSINHPTPLWTVSWYAFTVALAADGDHLVRLGPWASSTEQLALSFYSKGVEIKKYLIKDLVKDPSRLRYTVSHFFWIAKEYYDDNIQRFHLRTLDGIEYSFSMLTGEIVP